MSLILPSLRQIHPREVQNRIVRDTSKNTKEPVTRAGSFVLVAYSAVNTFALLAAALIGLFMLLLTRTKYMTLPVFTVLGLCLWLAVHESGISASITGVILDLLAPLTATKSHKRPIAVNLERALLPAATFIIVPLFVFANAGLTFKTDALHNFDNILVAAGIILGLVIGKVVGITGATWLVVKLRLGRLPTNTSWSQFIGIGFLAGVGFTISIFITQLAFGSNRDLVDAAKVGIFIGSVVSAGLGLYSLRMISEQKQEN